MEILIIGGGLLGMLTAREIAKAGKKITLIEKSEIGTESSWAGGGILSPLYPWRYSPAVNQLAKWGQQHYPALVKELIDEGGMDPEWTCSGMLVLDTDETTEALRWSEDYKLNINKVYKNELQRLEPELAWESEYALWLPEIAQIRNPRFLKSLYYSCQLHGVEFLSSLPVSRIIKHNGQVAGVETASKNINADKVIVASGAWSAKILGDMGANVDISPVRGQMLMYKGAPDLIKHIVLSGGHYVIPRRDGHILAGSTLENTGYNKSITEEGRAELTRFAERLFPCLADLPIERHWAGLRPGSPDGIPYICKVPACQGLYINSGHYRNGVILGPASARLMADIVLERDPVLDIQPYRIDRY